MNKMKSNQNLSSRGYKCLTGKKLLQVRFYIKMQSASHTLKIQNYWNSSVKEEGTLPHIR